MNSLTPPRLHVICERDVGLFSLIQQVIAHIPWAGAEKRVPIAFFGDRCCYWTPDGYADRDTVWEYYFEPVMPDYPAGCIPQGARTAICEHPPDPRSPGYQLNEQIYVSCHFGDHPGRALHP